MLKPESDPAAQFALSVLYTTIPRCIIPYEGEFLSFRAYGANRAFEARFSSGESAETLRGFFAWDRANQARLASAESERRAQLARLAPGGLDLDISL